VINALHAEVGRTPESIAAIMAGLIAVMGLTALVVVAWRP
jgi:hypothetical protein